MTRALRRLEGVTYWVIPDPAEIHRFINSNVRSEWEEDNREDGVDSRSDDWLLTLRKREWRIKSVEMSRVQLDPSMMSNKNFTKQLDKRSDEMRRSISVYHVVVWPIILRGEDYRLEDGYCRFTTLRKMGVRRVMAYIGSMLPNDRV